MRRHRPAILITGFGPFPTQPRNASSLLADAIAKAAPAHLPGFAIHAETLPTEWRAGPAMLEDLLERLQPVVALHFGVSHRAHGFVVETRARNALSDVIDACGETPDDACVAREGPAALTSTFPARQIVERLRRLGLPAQISRDAGGYLCNSVLYHSLHHANRHEISGFAVRRGFVHIPDRLIDGAVIGARRGAPSKLSWPGAVEGGLAILAACAGVAAV